MAAILFVICVTIPNHSARRGEQQTKDVLVRRIQMRELQLCDHLSIYRNSEVPDSVEIASFAFR